MTIGAILVADRGYETNAIRGTVTERGTWASIYARRDPQEQLPVVSWLCRQRNLVEGFSTPVKRFRGLATCYNRSPDNFLAALKIAAI